MGIAIIGSGKVAFQLSKALQSAEHAFSYVLGRNQKESSKLAKVLGATCTQDYADLRHSSMIIIAVHDDQIALVAAQIDRDYKGIVVHTSGSKPLSTLPSHLAQVAIFYPLYSFHSKRKISFKRIPILVTAKSQKVEETLQKLANSISEKCYVVTDKERATLHLAAVFANNFANFMMTINFDIIERAGLDKEMILPIIKQSATNWSNGEAINKQTGPAVRGDEKTMKSHMTALKNPALEELYHEISKNIIKYYK